MMRWLFFIFAVTALMPSALSVAEERGTWMIGFWHMTADEDHGPTGEVIEFRADGTYVAYTEICATYPAAEFHVFKGDIYVTSEIPGKGPVSVIFHPDKERTRLTFTSARTHNNATYERLASTKCVRPS
jgi:hypothetical protein